MIKIMSKKICPPFFLIQYSMFDVGVFAYLNVRLFSALLSLSVVPMGLYAIVQDRGSQVSQGSFLYSLLPVLGRGILACESYPRLPGVKSLELAGPLIKNT